LSSREKKGKEEGEGRGKKKEKKKSQGRLLAGPTLMRPCSASATSKQKRKKERKKGPDKYSSSSSFLPGKMQPVRDEHKPKFVQVSLLMSVVLLPPPGPREMPFSAAPAPYCLPAAATTAFFVFRAPAPASLFLSLFLTLDPFFFLTAICLLPYRVPFLCLGAYVYMCVFFSWPCLLPRQRYCVFRFIIE
jgi:hypothetical protein